MARFFWPLIIAASIVAMIANGAAWADQEVPTVRGVAIQGHAVDQVDSAEQKKYRGLYFCTPDRCPKNENDRKLAACYGIQSANGSDDIAACIFKFLSAKPNADRLKAIFSALELGWINQPWSGELLKTIFPLLNQEDPAIRNLYAQWYSLDNQRRGVPDTGIARLMESQNGRIEYKVDQTKPVNGVVQVGSVFIDISAPRQQSHITELGTGTLISAPEIAKDSTFVLTASHLIGGTYIFVRKNGNPLKIKSWIADNDHDLALVEIEKDDEEMGSYARPTGRITLSFSTEQGFYANTVPYAVVGMNIWEVMNMTVNWPTQFFMFLNPWNEQGIEYHQSASLSEDASEDEVGLSFDQSRMRARIKVTGGTSGSLVFTPSYGRPLVEGLIAQSNYYFQETFIPRYPLIAQLFEKFAAGQRRTLSPTTWEMKRGLTYRIFAGDWQEASFVSVPTGKGVLGDPGNGVLGDPGQTAKKGPSYDPWNESTPMAAFSHYGIQPGMMHNNQAVIAFLGVAKKHRTSWPMKLVLPADAEALEFMREFKNEYDFSPVNIGANLVDLLAWRLGRQASGQTDFALISGAPADLYREEYEFGYAKLASADAFIELKGHQLRVRVPTYAAYRFDPRSPLTDDIIDFTLDKKGLPTPLENNKNSFFPIIQIRGLRSGKLYNVDLRRLLFNDLSQISVSISHRDPSWLKKEALRQLGLIGIKTANPESGIEFGYTFKVLKTSQP